MSEKLLDAVVKVPANKAKRSIIWLHGLGADGHDFEDVAPMLRLKDDFDARFIFPHAPSMPVTVNQGMVMPAWFDIESLTDRSNEDKAGVEASQKSINRWIDHESSLVGSDNVFLVGFSQGGAMAAHCAFRYPKPLAGCAILSGYICLHQSLEEEASQANRALPVYVAHGTEDPMVNFQFAMRSVSHLTQLGWHPEFDEYPMEHQICMPEMVQLGAWLQKNG